MFVTTRIGASGLHRWAIACLGRFQGISVAYGATLTTRFHAFNRSSQDFYAVVAKLPYDPKVLTLVYDAREGSLGWHIWRKAASWVQVTRGGFNAALWGTTQGIGEIGFPAGFKPGVTKPSPPLEKTHGAPYEYFLTRSEPSGKSPRRNIEKRSPISSMWIRGARMWPGAHGWRRAWSDTAGVDRKRRCFTKWCGKTPRRYLPRRGLKPAVRGVIRSTWKRSFAGISNAESWVTALCGYGARAAARMSLWRFHANGARCV